jgi:nucleoside-diphosphate-sugar epimerase
MRIFLTGGTGVIGRRVVPLLLAGGHEVTLGTRLNSRRPPPSGVRTIPINLFDSASVAPAVQGHEVVVNLATHMPSSSTKMLFRSAWRTNDRIRRLGSRNLVDAALANGVRCLVQESFAPTYPDCGDRWIDESVPLEPAAYNRTVLDAESSVRRFSAAGRTGITLRFAAFYGPDSGPLKDFIRLLKKGWAPLPGNPRGFISSVSHDDAAAGVVAALRARPGEYNVVDDEPVRREEYAHSLAALLNVGPPRFPPSWATPLFGAVGKALARSLRISNRKFRHETGWHPRYPSVREGWDATLREMSQNANRESRRALQHKSL